VGIFLSFFGVNVLLTKYITMCLIYLRFYLLVVIILRLC